MTKTEKPASLAVICFNAFKDDTPLPCRLCAINDDTFTVHIMNTMTNPSKDITSVAIELAEDVALFAAAVASGLEDEDANKTFRIISDMISSISWTDDVNIFAKIEERVKQYDSDYEYCHFAQQILTILETGFEWKTKLI